MQVQRAAKIAALNWQLKHLKQKILQNTALFAGKADILGFSVELPSVLQAYV